MNEKRRREGLSECDDTVAQRHSSLSLAAIRLEEAFAAEVRWTFPT
ncbi:MAG: hypothetical protein IJK97_09985 [Thermoguttaceae bacterium]|nr:hypothetical protein [Thermoguttaceae bacterium]MBR0190783.1 hypothetical protein [Thermoguttaceae bacterium]